MKKNRCVMCGEDFLAGYKANACGECSTEKEFGVPSLCMTESLRTMQNVSRARLKELDKRVMAPVKMPGSDHNYVGTLERGKIKESVVDIRP